MTTGGRFTFADMQNPLFLHPSYGPTSVCVEKLQGAGDYRTWRRSLEIQLSSKRKLGFVNGTVVRSITYETQGVQWDTCNDLVISWLHNNVCENIKKSILFINTAHEIWKHLESRFLLSNGSRKYKLTKDLFSLKQNKLRVTEYYTKLNSLWEEIESMNMLPVVNTVAEDITALLNAIELMKSESKLFQFLNGLDDVYTPIRSQLLMQVPLPSVDLAYATIQQEEAQRDVLNLTEEETELSAMFSKMDTARSLSDASKVIVCGACGGKGHTKERCWTIVGYPKWHHKFKKPVSSRGTGYNNKWQGARSANVAVQSNTAGDSSGVMFTAKQLDHLLKLIPATAMQQLKTTESDDEMESPFSGMVTCNFSKMDTEAWIVDSGASDHMTAHLDCLVNVKKAPSNLVIKLPTGDSAVITHIGDVNLENDLTLYNVLYVPKFKQNLLSIHKLAAENNCVIHFHPTSCTIVDNKTGATKAVGTVTHGLYYLKQSQSRAVVNSSSAAVTGQLSDFSVWHHRMGHAPMSKLRHIPQLQGLTNSNKQIVEPLFNRANA